MKNLVVYVHGQGGNAKEAKHYCPLFQNSEVIGFDYQSEVPWDAKEEFSQFFDKICCDYQSVTIVANSIGAFFVMNALADRKIDRVFFISPIVNMSKLIEDMMEWAGVLEDELRNKGIIETSFGQTLSWEYLTYVRNNPIEWRIPTHILYGDKDHLTPLEVISAFAEQNGASLEIMSGGEHWFHTEEQMKYLDDWIKSYAND